MPAHEPTCLGGHDPLGQNTHLDESPFRALRAKLTERDCLSPPGYSGSRFCLLICLENAPGGIRRSACTPMVFSALHPRTFSIPGKGDILQWGA